MSLQFQETLTLSFNEARAGSQWEVTVEYEYQAGYRGSFYEPGHAAYCNVIKVLGKRLKWNPETKRLEATGDEISLMPFLDPSDIEGLEEHALAHYEGLITDDAERQAEARAEFAQFDRQSYPTWAAE